MKPLICFLYAFLSIYGVFSQDKIYKKNGNVVKVNITLIDENRRVISYTNHGERTPINMMSFEEFEKIVYEKPNKKPYKPTEKKAEVKDYDHQKDTDSPNKTLNFNKEKDERKVKTTSSEVRKVREYFDMDWNRLKDKKGAAYYREIGYSKEGQPEGVVKDYQINGELQWEGRFTKVDSLDDKLNILDGKCTWYYPNGRKQKEVDYKEGVYDGEYKEYYDTGKLRYEAVFKNNILMDKRYVEYDEYGKGELIAEEAFTDNKNNWAIGTVAEGSSQILNDLEETGYLIKTNSKASVITRWANFPLESQEVNYTVEARIKSKEIKGSSEVGLIFGLRNPDNYYMFLLNISSDEYAIVRRYEGINANISSWRKLPKKGIINDREGEENVIKIFKLKESTFFFINGLQVKMIEESLPLYGNNFGFYVSGKGTEIIAKYLKVKQPYFKPQEEKKKESKPIVKGTTLAGNWEGNGSGIIISKQGHITTNYHVIEGAEEMEVDLLQPDGSRKSYKVKLIETDKTHDLAILQIDDPKFKPFQNIPYTLKAQPMDAGEDVFAMGYPLADMMGKAVKTTNGTISSISGYKDDKTTYQISAPIQPGNSGGPLFDKEGNLVGITNAGIPSADNVGYAIKIKYVRDLIEELPSTFDLPNGKNALNKPLKDQIKILQPFVAIIKTKGRALGEEEEETDERKPKNNDNRAKAKGEKEEDTSIKKARVKEYFKINDAVPLDRETGKVSFVGVVEMQSITKNALFLRGKECFLKLYGTMKGILEIEDKEEGKLVGTTFEPFNVNPSTGAIISGVVLDLLSGGTAATDYLKDNAKYKIWYTLKIDVKENKYRYEISDIYYTDSNKKRYYPEQIITNKHLYNEKGKLNNKNVQVKQATIETINVIAHVINSYMTKTNDW
ncbi:trypsin-like peptidase domain-containing protein [Thermoflexibacter ruber]|uniref:DUF4468 domain-containing protein n=1 Tax=Thermoflexibacter ruber TaxID=1003 RepID=A0A1I2ACU8_9BACT|nr:trypsin-like peptidase domain-containing protein [Thermoflexibacter ruber]SFE41726.1 protein of unknown function [Thermoflexibacter ruber]